MAADILTLSSKGQVVLPAAYRRSLSLKSGDKLAAYARDGVIVLVPLRLPEEKEFEAWLDEAQAWARQEGLSPADVDAAIAEARSDA